MSDRVRYAAVLPVVLLAVVAPAFAGEQPVAIYHAFDQSFADVELFVCDLAGQGYSHVQIAPAQKSNPDPQWWGRYQPVDYSVIEGKGSEAELERLVDEAHGCGVKIIADVVLNHMANMDEFDDLDFPGLSRPDFHAPCPISYDDGNRDSEVRCWLGDLPDLDQTRSSVERLHTAHLDKLLALGVDGFRFDAAKHMSPAVVQKYVDHVDRQSNGATWNYLEVIQDGDTSAADYNGIAAVTDFVLYRAMKQAFGFGGDLRSLRVANAVDDPRSVTFGRNHDTIRELNPRHAIDPYDDRTDSFLATAFVLAREGGTPLILNWDSYDVPFVRSGVAFRRILRQRQRGGANVKENVLAVVDSPTLLVMERGSEGFFVVNKAASRFDVAALDVTLTALEGCYRELRSNFNVAIERRPDGKKWVTRWGSWGRGGMEVHARDALYFVREPWSQCQAR
ncbi:MAG: alpha-amylase family glycosyl hydrolase [Thermodesulfobacteriota bacterium]